LSGGTFVWGDFCLGGLLSGGAFVWGDFCLGFINLTNDLPSADCGDVLLVIETPDSELLHDVGCQHLQTHVKVHLFGFYYQTYNLKWYQGMQ